MEAWQQTRIQRAKEQNISVSSVECLGESFIFAVQGLSDEYIVDISQQISLWPPTCTCEDHYWRPGVLCKHILLCLKLMGVDEDYLMDITWEPDQEDLYEFLFHAPECVEKCLHIDHRS